MGNGSGLPQPLAAAALPAVKPLHATQILATVAESSQDMPHTASSNDVSHRFCNKMPWQDMSYASGCYCVTHGPGNTHVVLGVDIARVAEADLT